MRSNPGKTITIHNIPALSVEPINGGATPGNIKSGLAVTGIFPFNENIFSDEDFIGAEVTDRPLLACFHTPENESQAESVPQQINEIDVSMNVEVEPADLDRTLEDIHPFQKAPPRQASSRGRKHRRSAIVTDDCETEALRKEQADRTEKKTELKERKVQREENKRLKQAEKNRKEEQKKQKQAEKNEVKSRRSKNKRKKTKKRGKKAERAAAWTKWS